MKTEGWAVGITAASKEVPGRLGRRRRRCWWWWSAAAELMLLLLLSWCCFCCSAAAAAQSSGGLKRWRNYVPSLCWEPPTRDTVSYARKWNPHLQRRIDPKNSHTHTDLTCPKGTDCHTVKSDAGRYSGHLDPFTTQDVEEWEACNWPK